MKKYSVSLIIKIAGLVFIAFTIVLGNEMRLGIERYIKNTLESDASAIKVNLDKFSKSYVETLAMNKVDLTSEKFLNLYKDAAGGDSSKIKCLVDKNGKILDISREGQITPYLGLLLEDFKSVKNWPVYINLSSLDEISLRHFENLLKQSIDDINNVSITIVSEKTDLSEMNELDNIQVKQIQFNNEIVYKKNIKGKTQEFNGIVNSYENDNLEIYFYNMVRDDLKKESKLKTQALVMDYNNMINGLKMNLSTHFDSFIRNGTDLTSTNYAEYFLLKPYEYKNKYYSTVLLRLIDWSFIDVFKGNVDMNDKEILESMTVGYILVTQEYDDLAMNAFRKFIVDNSSTFFLTLLLIIVICLTISYSIVLPIRRIESTAKHIARKEFDYAIDTTRHDELGDLSRSIDTMSKELEKTINSLYQEVDRVQRLEEVRKEFVSNFTHEIKTPLGIINGFSELVELEQDGSKRNEYIQIIQSETKKINELVLAMLDLSKLESKNISLSLEEVDLLDIVDESIDSMMYLIEKKHIQLITELDSSIIQADRFKIEMVVDNFISNALRYTEAGKRIVIKLNEHQFSIENEGTHIPEEEFDKIWLTFHKIDKARNEEGTGLGLAICKAALESHRFEYGVQNTDMGVLFFFKF